MQTSVTEARRKVDAYLYVLKGLKILAILMEPCTVFVKVGVIGEMDTTTMH